MSIAETYPRLMSVLDEVRGRWRRQKLLEGILRTVATTGGVLTALVLADNLLQPGILGRALLAALLWGGLAAAVLSLVVKRWLEDRRDDYFAALVEERHPQLRNRLINALQLGRVRQRGVSTDLVERIVSDAENATTDLQLSDAVDTRPARKAALWALGAGMLVACYAALFSPYFANGLARLLLPASDIAPYTRTQIPGDGVQPGNTRVAQGEPVIFVARVEGLIPAAAQLHVRKAPGAWEALDMQHEPDHSDVFRFTLAHTDGSFQYQIRAGDGRSPIFAVEVVPPPQVSKLTLTVQPPLYTGQPASMSESSDAKITGLAGTRVECVVQASKPLQRATLMTREGQHIELAREGDDRTWKGSFLLWSQEAHAAAGASGRLIQAPTTYQIRLLDTDGYESNELLWHPMELLRDSPPHVDLLTPGDKLPLRTSDRLELTILGQDDFGLGRVRLLYRVNGEEQSRELAAFPHTGVPQQTSRDEYSWQLSTCALKAGDHVEYWAEAMDCNDITGPGRGESPHLSFDVVHPTDMAARFELNVSDYGAALEAILKLQRENRRCTAEEAPWDGLIERQARIREETGKLAAAMQSEGAPMQTIAASLQRLRQGWMAEALRLLESGQASTRPDLQSGFRKRSAPVQEAIIKELEALLARLQRNEQARKELRKLEKKDPQKFKTVTATLSHLIKSLDQLLQDHTEVAGKFERMPKRDPDALRDEKIKGLEELAQKARRAEKWARASVNELAKMAPGFVDDFGLRPDVNKVFEEVEKAAQRARAEKIEVSLEDLGAGLATKMKEDLEMWLGDTPDNVKWVLEEPLTKKPQKIPEMPLPRALEDLIGDLLQKADEFDQEADDVTSAWADNLDQAGWGVADGPISSFSAKGKTGNDMPNNSEMTGRSGDGRRGKSSGQMVGDTARALAGRKTPARVGNERYEPGRLKQQDQDDPNGATGGGKKSGAGRLGLQGGTPPDPVPNMGRLSAKQAGLRERAEQVAQKLDKAGLASSRLDQSIELMKSVEKDLRDHRYADAFRKRKDALQKLRGAFSGLDRTTATQIKKADNLPENVKRELLQAAEEGYPPGYEGLLKSYYKALSTSDR